MNQSSKTDPRQTMPHEEKAATTTTPERIKHPNSQITPNKAARIATTDTMEAATSIEKSVVNKTGLPPTTAGSSPNLYRCSP
jgi:phage gp29-like protein